MDVTVTLRPAVARTVPVRLAALKARQRIGRDTQELIDILEAVLAAMPELPDVGDDVVWNGSAGYVVHEFTNGGSMAIIHTIDRDAWHVANLADLTRDKPSSDAA